MPTGRRVFADSAPVSRSVRLDVDIVLPDEAARIQLDRLVVPRTTPEQCRAAGITLCAVGARHLEVTDRAGLEAAAEFVRPALEALGLVAAPDEQPPPADPDPEPQCGSMAGYSRHRRLREAACQPCLDANADYHRAYGRQVQHQVAPCGTETAYKRHRHRGESACEPCRLAHNQYAREKKAAQRAAAKADT